MKSSIAGESGDGHVMIETILIIIFNYLQEPAPVIIFYYILSFIPHYHMNIIIIPTYSFTE